MPRVGWIVLREKKVGGQKEEGGSRPSRVQAGIKREGQIGETLGSKRHLCLPLNIGLGEVDQTEREDCQVPLSLPTGRMEALDTRNWQKLWAG